MVPGKPGKPEEPRPNPQSYDTDCLQSRGWGYQGCLHRLQEGQGVIFRDRRPRKVILWCFHNFSIVDLSLVTSVDGLSVIGLQGLHCILTQ